MKLKELLQEKREEILKIAAKHGAYNVRVFGSVARGEDNENSDIDLLIDYDLEKITPTPYTLHPTPHTQFPKNLPFTFLSG